ncbi:MAG: hypothetical protein H6737_00770 [Alphaproteobacteria bacterium]|nr:hypothetical protein [Alphaproteobacteria bacterium]
MLALLAAAFADGPTVTATLDTEEVDGRKNLDTALHVGLDLRGLDPGLSGRFDLGHRVSVEGVVFAGIPTADRLKWTGGATLGLEVAPLRIQLGTHGSLDFRIGAGGMVKGATMASVEGAGLDLSEWAAGTLVLSPNGAWSFYGGLMASDMVSGQPTVEPKAGVRFKLD